MSLFNVKKAINRLNIDICLITDFFFIFSIFEYALKEGGFLTSKYGYAQSDWEEFCKTIEGKFQELLNQPNNNSLIEAREFLVSQPPMRQIVNGRRTDFEPITVADSDSESFTISKWIGCIRNNLFHGGKYPYGNTRNPLLIRSAIVILAAWARLDNNVERKLIETGLIADDSTDQVGLFPNQFS